MCLYKLLSANPTQKILNHLQTYLSMVQADHSTIKEIVKFISVIELFTVLCLPKTTVTNVSFSHFHFPPFLILSGYPKFN